MRFNLFLLPVLLSPLLLEASEKSSVPVHRYQLGTDLFWTHYGSGSSLNEEGVKIKATINGYFAGVRAGYDYLQPDAFYAGTEGVIAWGSDHIRQRTSLSPLTTIPLQSHTKHKHAAHLWANIEQRLGYNAQSTILPQFIVTPYLGIGWHYEAASHHHVHWYYGAAGLRALQRFYKRFELGFDFKTTYAFDVHDKMLISIITTQEKKTFWGFEIALPIRWLMGETGRWDVELKPYLLKLNLNSAQTIVGLRLVAGYSF